MKKITNFFKNKGLSALFSFTLGGKAKGQLSHGGEMTATTGNLQTLDGIVRDYHDLAQSTVRQAIGHGTNGIPDADSASSHAEEILHTGQHNSANSIKHHVAVKRGVLENSLKAEESNLEKMADADTYRQELIPDKNKKLERADRRTSIPGLWWTRRRRISIKGMLTALKEKLHHLEERKSHLEALYQHLRVEHYHHMPPVRGLIDHAFVFWGVISALVCLEILVNFVAFQNIGAGDNNLASLGLGIFFAICQAWSAEKMGSAFHKRNRSNIWLFLILTFVFCGFIIGTRWNMDEEKMIIRILYLVINAVFAGLTTVIAFFHAKHHEFFSVQLRRQKTSAQIEKKHYQVEQLELAYQKKREAIEHEFEAKALELAHINESEIKEKIERHRSELSHLDGHERQCLQHIESLYEGALTQYRHLNQEARQHNHYPQVKRWNPLGHAAAILFFMIGTGWGCSPVTPETHVEVLFDRTDTIHTQNIEPMLDYILNIACLEPHAKTWGEVTVTLSPIGETSAEPALVIHLPASEPFWSRNELEHRQKPENFKAELRHGLTALTEPGTGLDHSYIHRNFYYRLTELSQQKGRRIALAWSDLMVNDGEVSFYNYEKHPHLIWQQRDTLISRMTKDYPLPDLRGIKIINIHQSTKEMDERYEASKRFWTYYWTKQGAEVEFKTNLTPHNQPQLAQGHGH